MAGDGLQETSPPKVVTTQPTHGQVYAALMQAIRNGDFAPGAQLPNERQLAEDFRTSRQQIRDAMLLLQEAGLISRKVGSGTYLSGEAARIIEQLDAEVDVNALQERSFLETIEARLVIEPGVAALAARNANGDHLAELETALNAVRSAKSWIDYKSRIYRFSRVCYVAAGNAFLLQTFDQIVKARQDDRFDGHRANGTVAELVRRHSYDQLRMIFEAITAHDEARAETVTRDYLIGIAASTGLS